MTLSRKSQGAGIEIPESSHELLRPKEDGAPVKVFACCDARYYEAHAKPFLGSVFAAVPQCPVHLHLVNPTPGILRELDALYTQIRTFSASWEALDLSSLSQEEAGIYYYTIRFFRLREVFEAARSGCLCLDIDVLVNDGSFGALLDELVEVDLAFYTRFRKFGTNTKLLAGTLFVNYTPAGRHFLTYAAEKIEKFISTGHLLEKMDQQILYKAYLHSAKRFAQLRFKDMGYPIIDLNFTDSGLIWYPKGRSKRYDRYVERADICSRELSALLH